MRPRYRILEVQDHGYRVALILDKQTSKVHRIRLRGKTCLHWDLKDKAVTDPALRRIARKALA